VSRRMLFQMPFKLQASQTSIFSDFQVLQNELIGQWGLVSCKAALCRLLGAA
jgi:hypothetical protein